MVTGLKQKAKLQILPASWQATIGAEFKKPYIEKLRAFLKQEKQQGKILYPPSDAIFRAFELTPYEEVKVVILGQDPYHGPRQANGLCFSVSKGISLPPSLQNIYKELQRDLGIPPALHGDLSSWAKQGVLLLNSVLTVEQSLAAAHQGKGWEIFTDQVIAALNKREDPVIFVLWGNYAHKKGAHIDGSHHIILKTVHPSPLSAHRGFLGCGHFSQINEHLQRLGKSPINWQLPP
jgi:uracil-DNA glycosylase